MSMSQHDYQRGARELHVKQVMTFLRDTGCMCVWVPKGAAADVYALGRKLRDNTDLQVGPVRSVSTGKLSSSR